MFPCLGTQKRSPCFAGWDALLGPKTDRSGYWHVNQCADPAGSPAKRRLCPRLQDVSGLKAGAVLCMSMAETTSNSG